MEVVIPPQISDKLSTEDLSVREGGSAKFICSSTGHPQPTITWQKMPNGPREKARIRVTNDKGKETHRKTVHGEVLDIGKNPQSLCSRSFQNVKLRLDFVEI